MDSTQKTNYKRRASCPAISLTEMSINVQRLPLTQVAFDEIHLKQEKDAQMSLKERVCSKIYCDKKRTWKLLTSYVPLIKYIRYYKLREFAVTDILCGLSVGIVHIPQGLAFGQLTSVKIENGLFTSVWPVLLYVIFGTSPHVSMGSSAVISILTAATVDRLGAEYAADKPWLKNFTENGTRVLLDDVPEYLDYKEGIAMGVSLISGLMMIVLGMFKLGFITFYLSESFFTAFTSAAAVHIAVSQLPAMLGIKVARFNGVLKIVQTFQALIMSITSINWAAVIISIIVCVVIVLVKDCINERFKHKMFAPIPIELFIVIFAALASHFGNFSTNFGVDVVGHIPNSIPPPEVPVQALKESPKYLADAFIMAILIFANTIAMAKICAKKHNYEVDDSQELIAYGMCNTVSAFFKCFPSSVAPPRSMVASNMNARTTLNGISSAVLMVLFIFFIGALFTALPKASLAAIIFIALKGLFIQILDGRKFWKINKFDFVIWFCTFFSTVFLDIDYGLFIGVAVSLVTVVFQTQFARGYRIGKTTKDSALVELKRYADANEISGLKIFRFQSSLYFANAEIFRNSLYRNTVNPRKLLKFLKKREQLWKKRCKEQIAKGLVPEQRRNSVMTGENLLISVNSITNLALLGADRAVLNKLNAAMEGSPANGNAPMSEKKRKVSLSSIDNRAFDNMGEKSGSFSRLQDASSNSPTRSSNGLNKSAEFPSMKRNASIDSGLTINIDEEEVDEYGEVIVSDEKLKAMRRIHHVIIDCTPINYIDASGSNVLSHIITEYSHVGVKVFLAGCSADMRRAMKHAGAFAKIPQDHIFLELSDAIAVAKTKPVAPLSEQELEDFSDEEAIEDSYVTKM